MPAQTPPQPGAADHNLLFGILAVQLDFISRDALIQALHAWVQEKAQSVDQILLAQGALARDAHPLLEALVEKHLERHGHDAGRSLAAVSSAESVRQELRHITDPDLQASLDRVSKAPGSTVDPHASTRFPDSDPHATRSPSVGSLASAGTPSSAGLRFRILRPHAKGGLGQVSVALDEELHREVALKEIQDRHADDAESRARFLLEAEVTGGLEHPGIVPVYGLGQYSDGRPFYAMRFIQGDSLQEAIRRFHRAAPARRDPGARALQFRELLGRFVDVCNALAYAHSRGVLHRDLKPGNIMLGHYGETLVVDWGLAKALGRTDHGGSGGERPLQLASAGGPVGTQMNSVLGTPAFMSPEQAAGRLEQLGPASDIYSLGATLYALLTGRPPFEDPDLGVVLRKVQQGEFVPPRLLDRQVPPALEAICLKAMARTPADRYPTAQALAIEVEHWLADEPVGAWQEPWTVQFRRWVKRHRTAVMLAVGVLLIALVSLGLTTVGLASINQDLQEASQREQAATGTAAANYPDGGRDVVDQLLAKVTDHPGLQGGGLRTLRKELLEEAGKFYTRFIQERGHDPAYRDDLGQAYLQSARIAAELGAAAEALERYQQAVVIFQELNSAYSHIPYYRSRLAVAYHHVGDLHLASRRMAQAEEAYQRALTFSQQLAAEQPDEPYYQRALAAHHVALAQVTYTLGKTAEAEQACLRALALRQQLAETHPDVADYQRDLALSHSALGFLYQTSSGSAQAEEAYLRALALGQQLATAHSGVASYQSDLAANYHDLGLLYQALGKSTEAEQAYRQALALHQQMANAHPDVPHYRASLATAYNSLGSGYYDSGKDAQAEEVYLRARALRQTLAESYPDILDYRVGLGGSYLNLGHVAQRTDQLVVALRWYAQAVQQLEAVLRQDPRHAQAREWLRRAHAGRAETLTRSGRHAEALSEWDRALALDPGAEQDTLRSLRAATLAQTGAQDQARAEVDALTNQASVAAGTLYNAARVYAVSVVAADQDPTQAEHYVAHALALLARTHAMGFLKTPGALKHLKTDPAFDALRSHPDFRSLLRGLEP